MDTIDEVIDRLGGVVDEAYRGRSRLGLFASLYRRMTLRLRQAIASGVFEDGERFERLDVSFASRYFAALDAHRAGGSVSVSWAVAFRAAERPGSLVLQHLLLGINAHINLDLGIATAELAPAGELPALRHDFMAVNDVLTSLLDEIQEDIDELSPWLRVVDFVGGRTDEQLLGFSLERARDFGWSLAGELSRASPDERPSIIRRVDVEVAVLGHLVHQPPGLLKVAQWVALAAERRDVREQIATLRD